MPPAVAIAGAAVVGAGASMAAGSKAAKAQKNAAETSANVSRDQIAEERRQYDTTRADFAPYRAIGYGAVGKLASMYGVAPANADGSPIAGGVAGAAGLGYQGDGGFTASPGYAFTRDEGIKAAERSAAARGMLASGGTMKAIARYASGLASTDYNNYANRIAALAGVGQSATGSTAQAGEAAVSGIGAANQNIANAATTAGNARASSYANTGSAINSGVNNLASLYLYQQGGGFTPSATAGTPPIYGGTLGGIY